MVKNSGVIYNSRDSGNTINSYNNNKFNACNISISDERRQVLEWTPQLASWERHQAVRDARVEGVGDWLLRDRSFSAQSISEDRTAKPALFYYGHPGAGKTYVR